MTRIEKLHKDESVLVSSGKAGRPPESSVTRFCVNLILSPLEASVCTHRTKVTTCWTHTECERVEQQRVCYMSI